MAFGSFGHKPNTLPMAEINMVPLIDVMLVLLVIFIVTAPLLTHSVKVNLPQATSEPTQAEPAKIDFAINDKGELFWDGAAVTMAEATSRLQEAGKRETIPELHLRADRNTRYELIAQIMSEAAKAGVTKLGFVSDPTPPPPP